MDVAESARSLNLQEISNFFGYYFGVLKNMPTFASQKGKRPKPNAKIAQLVEHDLAKVGVAGSSPVFRSKSTMK